MLRRFRGRALLDIGDVIDIELLGEEKPDPEEGEEGCIPWVSASVHMHTSWLTEKL